MPIFKNEVPERQARQMIMVGAVISTGEERPGKVLDLCGQPCVIVGEITRAELYQKVLDAGLPVEPFAAMPDGLRFYSISTD